MHSLRLNRCHLYYLGHFEPLSKCSQANFLCRNSPLPPQPPAHSRQYGPTNGSRDVSTYGCSDPSTVQTTGGLAEGEGQVSADLLRLELCQLLLAEEGAAFQDPGQEGIQVAL